MDPAGAKRRGTTRQARVTRCVAPPCRRQLRSAGGRRQRRRRIYAFPHTHSEILSRGVATPEMTPGFPQAPAPHLPFTTFTIQKTDMKRGDVIGTFFVAMTAVGAYLYYKKDAVKESPAAVAAMVGTTGDNTITIQQRWEMPGELKEVSANVWAGNGLMGLVEDNHGIIYLYNLASRSVERRIEFSANGDYEGLTLVGSTWYVLRSDGTVFEVTERGNDKPEVKSYKGPFGDAPDCESLTYDAANKRLLVGVKERDPNDPVRKGVYTFNLSNKTFGAAAYYIAAGAEGTEIADKGKKKKRGTDLRPSDIALAPNGGLYVLNGPEAELLLTDESGNVERVIALDKSIFPQPEGICFSPSGDLYISSEAGRKKGVGMLAQVRVNP
ncbi:MAG: hypothetical protein EOO11_14865 [Chitinophagaceae bacterium]|nr:MAG: hypothetical protein EOO11_14865 [Chitinophagaceae bacterium]